MKIVQLTTENVKRLQAVEIKPDGSVIVIGGKNGAGKSSVLDSIQWALAGKPEASMPVRKGETKAQIVADLGDLVVTRTITPSGGGSLIVRNADGVRQESPQAILDKLVGKLTFDPLDFSRQKPAQQAETLRGLVGLNFADQDREREKQFAARTQVNRELSSLKARVESLPKHDGLPAEELSVMGVMSEQAEAVATNAANAAKRRTVLVAGDKFVSAQNHLTELERQAKELSARIETGKAVVENLAAEARLASEAVAKIKDIDVSVFQTKLREVEETNRKIQSNDARKRVVEQYKDKLKSSEHLSAAIEKIDAAKRKAINEAKYPIEGLAFDTAGGVTLGAIPFEQCSSAEQLRVSVAIGLALNPTLRVLLIRDGSLLDQDSMKVIAAMADKADAQVWMERVGVDDSTSVIIEDGAIKLQEQESK